MHRLETRSHVYSSLTCRPEEISPLPGLHLSFVSTSAGFEVYPRCRGCTCLSSRRLPASRYIPVAGAALVFRLDACRLRGISPLPGLHLSFVSTPADSEVYPRFRGRTFLRSRTCRCEGLDVQLCARRLPSSSKLRTTGDKKWAGLERSLSPVRGSPCSCVTP